MSIIGQGTIPDDWEGEYCRYSVRWPNSPQWLAVLRGVLVLPSRGRFWDEHTGNIIEAQNVVRQTYDKNLHLEEVLMSCNDTALNQIAAALMLLAQNTGHCCQGVPPGNSGVQIVIPVGPSATPTPLYGSVPPVELPRGEVPPAFDGTLEEFQEDQCRTANQFVDNWADSIEALAHINFAGTAGLTVVIGAALIGLIVLPEFLIPILIAACIVLVIGEIAWFGMADGIRAHRDEIVCAILLSEGALDAFERLSLIVDDIITTLSLATLKGAAIRVVALVLVNTDTLNFLFEFSQGVGPDYDCTDCFVCVGCLNRVDSAGNTTGVYDVGGGFNGVSAGFDGGFWNVAYAVNSGSAIIEWQALAGYTPTGGPNDFMVGQETQGDIYSGNSFSEFAAAAAEACLDIPTVQHGQWQIASATDFDVQIKTIVC